MLIRCELYKELLLMCSLLQCYIHEMKLFKSKSQSTSYKFLMPSAFALQLLPEQQLGPVSSSLLLLAWSETVSGSASLIVSTSPIHYRVQDFSRSSCHLQVHPKARTWTTQYLVSRTLHHLIPRSAAKISPLSSHI